MMNMQLKSGLLALTIAVMVGLAWPFVQSRIQPPIPLAAIPAGSVVLYSTTWCGYCTKTRHFLNKNKIPFVEHDIETSADAYRDYKALGGQGVPVVRVSDQVLHGYDPDGIISALRQSERLAITPQ